MLIAIIAGSVGGALALCALIAAAALLSRRRGGGGRSSPSDAMASSRDLALEKLRHSYGSAPPAVSEYDAAPSAPSSVYDGAPPLRSDYDAPSSRLD